MRRITNYPENPSAGEREKKHAQDMMDFQQRGGYFLTGHTTARKFWGDFGEGMNGQVGVVCSLQSSAWAFLFGGPQITLTRE